MKDLILKIVQYHCPNSRQCELAPRITVVLTLYYSTVGMFKLPIVSP